MWYIILIVITRYTIYHIHDVDLKQDLGRSHEAGGANRPCAGLHRAVPCRAVLCCAVLCCSVF